MVLNPEMLETAAFGKDRFRGFLFISINSFAVVESGACLSTTKGRFCHSNNQYCWQKRPHITCIMSSNFFIFPNYTRCFSENVSKKKQIPATYTLYIAGFKLYLLILTVLGTVLCLWRILYPTRQRTVPCLKN
jgi:hypothetical protein